MEDFPGWSNDLAFTEGWGIFEMDPPRNEFERYQLQYLQVDGFKTEAGVAWGDRWFEDEQAFRHVLAHASYGSAYHITALDWLRCNSPGEWAHIIL